MISASPNQLHDYDPVTGTDTVVALPAAPLSLTLSPLGNQAAIGFDGQFAQVDLQNHTLGAPIPVPMKVDRLAVSNSYAYLFASNSNSGRWVKLSDSSSGQFDIGGPASGVALDPLNSSLYVSATSFHAFDITNGVPAEIAPGPLNGVFAQSPLTIAPNYTRLYGACPSVAALKPDAGQPPTYFTSLPFTSIQSIDDGFETGRLAVIPSATRDCLAGQPLPLNDSHVVLLNDMSLKVFGTLQLAPFSNGATSFVALGRYVFFSSEGTRLYAISQAAPNATGLANTFEVQSFDLNAIGSCTPILAATTASAPAAGITASVAVTAPADCGYPAVSSDPWLQVVTGVFDGGNSVVRYIVRPNTTNAPRSGHLTIGSQVFTVTQDAGTATPPSFTRLSFPILAADYSQGLDRLVLLAAPGNELHIYDPVSGDDKIVLLPRTGVGLSVSHDGFHAVVAHAGLLSDVDLMTGAIDKAQIVPQSPQAIALTSSGIAYFNGNTLGDLGLKGIDLNSGAQLSSDIPGGSVLRLHRLDSLLYGSQANVRRFKVSSTAIVPPTAPGAPTCGNLWIADDGSRYTTACGKSYVSSAADDQRDGMELGTFADLSPSTDQVTPVAQWVAEAALPKTTAVIPSGATADSTVRLYSDATGGGVFGSAGQVKLPPVNIGGVEYASHGRYAFFTETGNRLIVLSQTDASAALESPWTVDVISPAANPPGCTVSLSPTSLPGPSGKITVTAGPNCVWTVQNDNPWLTLQGAFGVGNSTIDYMFGMNHGVLRSGILTINGQNIPITQQFDPTLGLTFAAGPQCRLVDTRNENGPSGGPGIGASGVREFTVNNAICGISLEAAAVALNITAIPKGPLGFLSVYPAGQARPEVSTLNSYDGRVVANSAILPVGAGSKVAVYATDPTDVVIDVTGFFIDGRQGFPGLSFFPMFPCRAVDTRNAPGALGGPGLTDTSRTFPLANSACQPPVVPQAYSLNVTAVPSGTLNYLTVWTAGMSQPIASTLNSYDGSVVANGAIVHAGANAAVSVAASGSTDVLLDVNGVFAPAAAVTTLPGVTPLRFFPVLPCRVTDTRGAAGPALAGGASRDFTISGSCGIPANAQAYALNVTVVPKTNALHFLTLWPSGQVRPEVSTLNSYQGKVLANATIVRAGTNGAVSAFATEDTELILDVTGYFAP